jgi:hypothetical protein
MTYEAGINVTAGVIENLFEATAFGIVRRKRLEAPAGPASLGKTGAPSRFGVPT